MPTFRVTDKATGKVYTINGNRAPTEEELTRLIDGQPSAQGGSKQFVDPAALSTGGSIAGGVLGPAGTAAGYAMGKSAGEISNQMRNGGTDVLANILGKIGGAKLTKYGQQRAEELGYTGDTSVTPEMLQRLRETGQKITDQPEVDLASMVRKNLTDPEHIKEGLAWGGNTIKEAAVAGLTDYIFRGASKAVTEKLLPKVSPLFRVKGVTPGSINKSATAASTELWDDIAKTIDKADDLGKTSNTAPILEKLNKAREQATKGFTADEIMKLPKDNSVRAAYDGITRVMNEVTDVVDAGGNISPNKMQTIKSLMGTKTFTTTGSPKASTNVKFAKELTGRKIAGGEFKKNIIATMQEMGVKNPNKMFSDWAKLNNIKDLSSRGLQSLVTRDVFGSKIIGTGAGVAAGVGSSSPVVGLAAYLALTPYGQQLMREGIKLPFKISPYAARVLTPMIIQNKVKEYIFGEKE